ncbi:hypothetical protein RYX36_006331, partial [Vicia faba]
MTVTEIPFNLHDIVVLVLGVGLLASNMNRRYGEAMCLLSFELTSMCPDITFGQSIKVSLDVGCGVASFGAYLLSRNVITMSVAPKDVHENQIQFALERGVPAMVVAFATRRLLYPSQAFDLIHCSRCRINWTRDDLTLTRDADGILLLEVNRMLRAGRYFVWAAQSVYKHEQNLEEQWE